MEKDLDGLADYLFELGQLKRQPRSGWALVGVANPESVAEHIFRTALLAYVLAETEGLNPERAACIALVHDNAESRVQDQHHLARSYLNWEGVEETAQRDQTAALPVTLRGKLRALFEDAQSQCSPESIVAKDADRLECLLQACEYRAGGHLVDEWIRSSQAGLRTESAKALAQAVLAAPPDRWRTPPRRL